MSLVRTILTTWLAVACLGLPAGAAEIELRAQCACSGAVVTLGDVADVGVADPAERARLEGIELGPAPPPGRPRTLRQREIQDLLLLGGVNLAQHRFTGASQTTIQRGDGVVRTSGLRPVSAAVARRAARQLGEAIVEHLNRTAASQPWSVAVELSEEQARLVAGVGHKLEIRGGRSPWVGRQTFDVLVTLPTGSPATFSVTAEVSLPEAVVVCTRSLPRGAILGTADLRLERVDSSSKEQGAFHAIEELVGKEAVRAIPAGVPIAEDWIISPVLVRRGEVVSVLARSAGIRLTTHARAREDGSHGDLVRVESLEDRTTYFARVCGLRSLEVLAGPVQAATPARTAGVR